MTKRTEYLGYIKIEGAGIDDGIIGARSGGQALLGINDTLKYFLKKSDPNWYEFDFDIPVKVQKGSWQALIPDSVMDWLLTAGGTALVTYLTNGAKKLSDNDFKDVTTADLFRDAIGKMQSVVRIAKHIGTMGARQLTEVKFVGNLVTIPNLSGKTITISRAEFDLFVKCPESLLNNLVGALEKNQKMRIAQISNEGVATEEEIDYKEKQIFVVGERNPDSELLFPELVHGEYVELVGMVTRAKKN